MPSAGSAFLQMPTTTLRIIRLDAGAFAIQPSADDVRGTTGQRRSGRRFNWSQSDLNVPLVLSCELIGGGRWSYVTAG
jgi:hypothetical protein